MAHEPIHATLRGQLAVADGKTGGIVAAASIPVVVVGSVFSLLLLGGADSCGDGGAAAPGSHISIDPDTVPDISIAGYGHEQLVNAAHIVQAGKALGLSVRDQNIGVMTAMGESSLVNIEYGDWETAGVRNPDGSRTTSIGLFQQQDGWGSREERLDPHTSATKFFEAMTQKVPDRASVQPTIVAHRTQINADPYHYERYWDAAVQIVEGLSGVQTGLSSSNPVQNCPGGDLVPGTTSPDGWATPSEGRITSPYGWRMHPIHREPRFHYGTDFSSGCGSPIWAAGDGVVTGRGFDSVGNGYINIDHGGGVVSRYLHMYDSGMFVNVGETVTGGQHIAAEGSSGASTGCHLHFEIKIHGENVDPADFMAGVGVTFG